MAPTLYMFQGSPPVGAVLITAKAIGLDLEEKRIDFSVGEHLKPEFLKLNPQHTVPTLVDDDGFTIWDNHAIMVYLVSRYGKNDALYPKDIRKRAIINQRLHFESGVVFVQMRAISRGFHDGTKNNVTDADKESANEVYAFLETFLSGNKWVAGDSVSVADYSLISSISCLNIVVPIDAEKYPKVVDWMKNVQGLPEFEVNRNGLSSFAEFFKSKLSKA